MAFIRQKGKNFYVVENRRESGKVKQTVLACLGRYPSVPVAIEKAREDAEAYEGFTRSQNLIRPTDDGHIKGMVNSDLHLSHYFTGGYGNATGSQPNGCWFWRDIYALYRERSIQLKQREFQKTADKYRAAIKRLEILPPISNEGYEEILAAAVQRDAEYKEMIKGFTADLGKVLGKDFKRTRVRSRLRPRLRDRLAQCVGLICAYPDGDFGFVRHHKNVVPA